MVDAVHWQNAKEIEPSKKRLPFAVFCNKLDSYAFKIIKTMVSTASPKRNPNFINTKTTFFKYCSQVKQYFKAEINIINEI